MNQKRLGTALFALSFMSASAFAKPEALEVADFTLNDLNGKHLELESIYMRDVSGAALKCDYSKVKTQTWPPIESYNGRSAVAVKRGALLDECNLGFNVVGMETYATTGNEVQLFFGYETAPRVNAHFRVVTRPLYESNALAACKLKKYGGLFGQWKNEQVDCQLNDNAGKITFRLKSNSEWTSL